MDKTILVGSRIPDILAIPKAIPSYLEFRHLFEGSEQLLICCIDTKSYKS